MRITRVMLAGLLSLWTALSPVAAALAADAPVAAPAARTFKGPTSEQADAAIAELRNLDAGLADDVTRLKAALDALIPEKLPAGEALPKNTPEQIAELNRRAHDFVDRAQVLIKERKLKDAEVQKTMSPSMGYILPRLYMLGLESAPMHLDEVSAAMTEIERRADALDADTKGVTPAAAAKDKEPFEERLHALNAEGTRVWNRLHAAALNIDDLGATFDEEKTKTGFRRFLTGAGQLDVKANPLQARVADLSRKLQEIGKRLHGDAAGAAAAAVPGQTEALRARMNKTMADPFNHPEEDFGMIIVVAKRDGPAKSDPKEAAAAPAAAAPPAERPATLLDIRHVPAPSAAAAEGPEGPRPPVFAGRKGEDSAPEETKKVNALRAAGKTRTIGDPEKRAKFVFEQEGETCAIAAQVQVLADAGALPPDPDKLRDKSEELYQKAVAAGYFNGKAGDPKRRFHGGTDGQYVGDLLDMPVRKHFDATEEDLFKAVSSGRMVIVSFKTSKLWNTRKYNGGHIVAVTGVEVDRENGKPLGYYINDTGTNEGGRFVAVKQFMAGWKIWGSLMIEPL